MFIHACRPSRGDFLFSIIHTLSLSQVTYFSSLSPKIKYLAISRLSRGGDQPNLLICASMGH
jgi:hypothetical protein